MQADVCCVSNFNLIGILCDDLRSLNKTDKVSKGIRTIGYYW